MVLFYFIIFLAVIYMLVPGVKEKHMSAALQFAEPGLDGIAAMFRTKIYLALFVAIMIVYSTGLTWNREHMTNNINSITREQLQHIKLKTPYDMVEYNMNNIPTDVKLKLNNLLKDNVILQTGKRLTPLSWEFVRVYRDNEKSYWYVDCFIQNSDDFTTKQLVWIFWILPGEKYKLIEIRPYSMKEEKPGYIQFTHGVRKNHVITDDNLQMDDNTIMPLEGKTDLEQTGITTELSNKINNRKGLQSKAVDYNKWILPNTVIDKQAYVSFTPDILNPINYNTGKFADLFSRTRHDAGFPHGQSTA